MIITLNSNKDLEHFEHVFSIEHIIHSIKKLKEQVKNLESKQPYQIVTPSPINPVMNEESKCDELMNPSIHDDKFAHKFYLKPDLSLNQI